MITVFACVAYILPFNVSTCLHCFARVIVSLCTRTKPDTDGRRTTSKNGVGLICVILVCVFAGLWKHWSTKTAPARFHQENVTTANVEGQRPNNAKTWDHFMCQIRLSILSILPSTREEDLLTHLPVSTMHGMSAICMCSFLRLQFIRSGRLLTHLECSWCCHRQLLQTDIDLLILPRRTEEIVIHTGGENGEEIVHSICVVCK